MFFKFSFRGFFCKFCVASGQTGGTPLCPNIYILDLPVVCVVIHSAKSLIFTTIVQCSVLSHSALVHCPTVLQCFVQQRCSILSHSGVVYCPTVVQCIVPQWCSVLSNSGVIYCSTVVQYPTVMQCSTVVQCPTVVQCIDPLWYTQ